MGFIEFTKDDQVTPDLQQKLDDIIPKTNECVGDLGDIYKSAMHEVTPIGATHELYDFTTIEWIGEFMLSVFSESGHFDSIVTGHTVLGPYTSDKQLKWWFWYLRTVLGGEYEPKVGTGNKTEANDYPSLAYDNAQGDVDSRLDQYLEYLVS